MRRGVQGEAEDGKKGGKVITNKRCFKILYEI